MLYMCFCVWISDEFLCNSKAKSVHPTKEIMLILSSTESSLKWYQCQFLAKSGFLFPKSSHHFAAISKFNFFLSLPEQHVYVWDYRPVLITKKNIVGICLCHKIMVSSCLVKIQSISGETDVNSPWHGPRRCYMEAMCCQDYMHPHLSWPYWLDPKEYRTLIKFRPSLAAGVTGSLLVLTNICLQGSTLDFLSGFTPIDFLMIQYGHRAVQL